MSDNDNDYEELDDDDLPLFTPEQAVLLWLMGASKDWELASDVPQWVKDDAVAQGLAFQTAPDLWRKTLRGDNLLRKRMAD